MNFSLLTPFLLIFLVVAYYLTDLEVIKIIPVTISTLFFLLFLFSYLQEKKLVLKFTQKFYKKELSQDEIEYISSSDGYWMLVTFVNSVIQTVLALYGNTALWVFYVSVGWYVFFFFALIVQIFYGKLYVVQPYSNDKGR